MTHISYPQAHLAHLQAMETQHFWYIGRRALILDWLARNKMDAAQLIVDIGSGASITSRLLREAGYPVVALDYYASGLQAQVGTGLPLVQANATQLPFAPQSIDAVMLLDVLEHTDDAALLAGIARALPPGGLILVTVPAFPFLWSYRDTAAGHLRRYTRRSLHAALLNAGFVVEDSAYYQFTGMLIASVVRVLGRNSAAVRDRENNPGGLLNAVMRAVNLIEVRLSRVVPLPFGTSLIAVGRLPR